MKHFLCTRFNLKNDDWTKTKTGSDVLTADWLSQRFQLFKQYCLPSVLNQTNKNFTWFIFFDIDTPEDFKDAILKLARETKGFTPYFINGNQNLKTELKRAIKDSLEIDDQTVITTRLDNDDAIHKDFIGRIQELSKGKERAVIDLIRGYQLNIDETPNELRNHFKYYNPFISLLESTNNFETVFSRDHYEWSKEDQVIAYKGERLWLEVVHRRNMINDVKSEYYLTKSFSEVDFGLENIKIQNKLNTSISNFKLRLRKLLKRMTGS